MLRKEKKQKEKSTHEGVGTKENQEHRKRKGEAKVSGMKGLEGGRKNERYSSGQNKVNVWLTCNERVTVIAFSFRARLSHVS